MAQVGCVLPRALATGWSSDRIVTVTGRISVGTPAKDWLQSVRLRARTSAAAESRHSGTDAVADRSTHKPAVYAQLWG